MSDAGGLAAQFEHARPVLPDDEMHLDGQEYVQDRAGEMGNYYGHDGMTDMGQSPPLEPGMGVMAMNPQDAQNMQEFGPNAYTQVNEDSMPAGIRFTPRQGPTSDGIPHGYAPMPHAGLFGPAPLSGPMYAAGISAMPGPCYYDPYGMINPCAAINPDAYLSKPAAKKKSATCC